MKLSLKHIQKLEILLKRLLSVNNLDIQLSLVVKIDDSLYSGDFTKFKSPFVLSDYLNFDGYVDSNRYPFTDLIKVPSKFDYKKYYNILNCNDPLLLKTLLDLLDSCRLKDDFELPSIITNVKKLDSDLSLPYLYLDDSIEYDIVSIIKL